MYMMWYIKKTCNEKGYGLFASEKITCDATILEEDPIVSCQFSWNKLYKYKACDFCMKSLETTEQMCRRLAQNTSIVLPHPECCISDPNSNVECPNCEIPYCSKECRLNAYHQFHKVLCPELQQCDPKALHDLDETWRGFHYPPETATIMLIIRLLARIKLEPSKEDFIGVIESFCHESSNENEQIAHKLLGDKYKVQLSLLREQVRSVMYEESVSHWFTEDGFQTLFALLGTNQQGIGTSALSVWVKNCDSLDLPEAEREQLDSLIDDLYEELDKTAGSFLNCEGAGLYATQSKCNHSCTPNAEVSFLHNNHRLTIKATRDITADEEITISYLGECELSRSRHSRQKYLKENYLFMCKCEKCHEEADQPDETSEEEETDDCEEDME